MCPTSDHCRTVRLSKERETPPTWFDGVSILLTPIVLEYGCFVGFENTHRTEKWTHKGLHPYPPTTARGREGVEENTG